MCFEFFSQPISRSNVAPNQQAHRARPSRHNMLYNKLYAYFFPVPGSHSETLIRKFVHQQLMQALAKYKRENPHCFNDLTDDEFDHFLNTLTRDLGLLKLVQNMVGFTHCAIPSEEHLTAFNNNLRPSTPQKSIFSALEKITPMAVKRKTLYDRLYRYFFTTSSTDLSAPQEYLHEQLRKALYEFENESLGLKNVCTDKFSEFLVKITSNQKLIKLLVRINEALCSNKPFPHNAKDTILQVLKEAGDLCSQDKSSSSELHMRQNVS